MINENGNGVVEKLVTLRQAFLLSVDAARNQFVTTIRSAREDYLGQIVGVTLGDPRLSNVEQALSSWTSPSPTQPPDQGEPDSPVPPAAASLGMVPIGQSGDPTKFPMKGRRVARDGKKVAFVYGHCSNCNSAIWEPQAKFCSQCAMPFAENLSR